MIPDAYRLRRAAIAYVFPGQPDLRREEALQFYDRVTGAGIEAPQFNFERNTLRVLRTGSGEPTTTFGTEIGHHEGNFRLFIVEEWPDRAFELTKQDSDILWEGFRETWSEKRLGGRPVLVETNLRLDVPADGGDATEYLVDDVLHLPHEALGKLRRDVQGIGVKITLPVEVTMGPGGDEAPLNGANARIRIETLLDDTSKIYLEAVSKWPSVPVPAEVRQQQAGNLPEKINAEARRPSDYLSESYSYVTEAVTDFISSAAEA